MHLALQRLRPYPARSGRPGNVALRLYIGPSMTDVFRRFRRYQQTFVERPRERLIVTFAQRSQKMIFKCYEYVLTIFYMKYLLVIFFRSY